MDEFLQLIVVEGLYQTVRAIAAASGRLVSRVEFCQMRHVIPVNVDGLIALARVNLLPGVFYMERPRLNGLPPHALRPLSSRT